MYDSHKLAGAASWRKICGISQESRRVCLLLFFSVIEVRHVPRKLVFSWVIFSLWSVIAGSISCLPLDVELVKNLSCDQFYRACFDCWNFEYHMLFVMIFISGNSKALCLRFAMSCGRFIYFLLAVGIILCSTACIGHIAAEAMSGCCLCFVSFHF